MTFEELKPLFRQMSPVELRKTAEVLIVWADKQVLRDELDQRELEESVPEPRNVSEEYPGVVTYPTIIN